MKNRTLLFVALTATPILIAGCALYKNPSACEQQMRSALAEKSPADKLSISHAGVGFDGTRVVVEGTIERARQTETASVSVTTSASRDKPKKVEEHAAAECTFEGRSLVSFRWLAPPDMLAPAESSGE